ncbi:MAG: YihY/virulence factor BrkB family protein [Oscillospiraceae bacterium]|nr:YihY/virulence factor BrkB family protein [Oscillospiraceae bacterium]
MNKIRKLIDSIQKNTDFISRWQLAASASSTAFWFFLSLVPIVMLITSILPYTSLTEEQVLTAVTPVFPASFNALIRVILADVFASSLGVLSVSVLATVWSSGRGFASLIRGLELVYEQKHRSGFLPRRARGVIYTLCMVLAMVLSIVLGGFGRQIIRLTERYLPGIRPVIAFLLHFRFVLVIALLTLFFCGIYRWATNVRPRFRELFPGALLAAGGWCLFTWLFSALVAATGSYGTYGNLASVVAVMLWLYYCQYILLMGACFNRALPRIAGLMSRRREEP